MTWMTKIRELTKEDIDLILELEAHSAPQMPAYFAYDRKDLENDIFSSKGNKAFGAFDGSRLVGWGAYEVTKDGDSESCIYQMSSLVVDKEFRRKGIGLQLLEVRMQDILKKKDAKEIFVTTYPKNSPTLIMYLTHGFVIYDFKKNAYGEGADRVYLKYDGLE